MNFGKSEIKMQVFTWQKFERGSVIMKNKTEQLDELFQKWYSEQKKSDFKNHGHFSMDGLIKTDDEDCVVLFVLAEPHSEKDHMYNTNFWFRDIWEDYDAQYNYKYDDPRDTKKNRCNITKYKNRIELCAKSLGVTEIPHGIAVMDMKKCGDGSNLSKNFYKYVDTFAEFIKNQIEIINPQYIVACGAPVFNALQRIGLDEETKSKIIKTWHLAAQKSNSEFTFNKLP
ncbi:MAG: hypothetical protein RR552_00655 [Oscillospiraceae bacterium]